MKLYQFFAVIGFMFYATWSLTAAAADVAGKSPQQILDKAADLLQSDDFRADVEMRLVDHSGHERVRRLRSFSKREGQNTYSISSFYYPGDVAGTSFLAIDKGGRSQRWLYLPALKKEKLIGKSERHKSYMGTDFTYADMEGLKVDEYNLELLPNKSSEFWIIKATPKTSQIAKETGYSKSLVYVRKDNNILVKAARQVVGSSKIKVMKIRELQLIDGKWTAIETEMLTKLSGKVVHRTTLKLSNVSYRDGRSVSFFSPTSLAKGI
tara:strand:- start:110 stop:907 length:798 start_codon:yes stop_codon:yes gene_type:complete